MEDHTNNTTGELAERVRHFLAYSFDTDQVYQQGLAGILSSSGLEGKSTDEQASILLNAQLFYFSRITGVSLTPEDVHKYRNATPTPVPAPAAHGPEATGSLPDAEDIDEPHVLSFAELKELIEQGKTDQIPNNKKIPDVLNHDKPSESKAAIRRKPWEIAAETKDEYDTVAES